MIVRACHLGGGCQSFLGDLLKLLLWAKREDSLMEPKVSTGWKDEWGNDEDGKDFWRVTPIEYHICTLEELGLGNGKG